ncbi:hypothetical protein WA026_000484 [Henosepilachna vigintioctopunctata]|uniref:ribonuclease H n=1 Tax=Henosepilachna vigintioctopunctata TaxID=420089 RepID=A0AAW1V663_9CUCU
MLPDKFNDTLHYKKIQYTKSNLEKTNMDNSAQFLEMKSKYHEYTTLYKDASDPQNRGNMGLGIYCPDRNIKLSGSHPGSFSICTSEVAKIMIALNVIKEENIKKSIIFTDSISALKRISNWKISVHNDKITMLTWYRINEIKNLEWEVMLMWIPSHTNIPGNEQADRLAKEGTKPNLITIFKCHYNEILPTIKKEIW